jgi:2-polyprenyl-6-methoxyphenol hydroxylase-like FAD-dependent oxidoreductase
MITAPSPRGSTSVLVVGGGLTGLSAALFLAWRGVPTTLVERHAGSSPHPRAIGFTTRTLEMFRAVGLGARIPQIPAGHGRPRRVAVESLAGKWAAEVEWTPDRIPPRTAGEPGRPRAGYSPCTGAAIAQDRLEPILRDKAIELGADVRMSTELVSFRQEGDGIAAVVRPRNETEYTVRADYVIAADGHASPIREGLGIACSGHGFMHVVRSVLFRADLEQYLESGISQFELDQPGLKGMLTTYRDGRWLLMFADDEDRDEATLRAMVRRAIGRDDIDVELITTGRWELGAFIADRFSAGRVFLIGDAAHTLPPARGGYGANTGIEDAFNIAWKLEAVTSGASAPELLESYDVERRPIAWLRHGQIFARRDYAGVATDEEKRVAIIEDDAMELGQLYRSKAVLDAGANLPPAQRPEQWGGQPGTRAQHLWVTCGDERLSTLDLLQRSWMLVTEDPRWIAAAMVAGERAGIQLRCTVVGGAGAAGAISVSPPLDGAARLTIDTPIEQIVAVPAGKAVLDALIPELTTHATYPRFKSIGLRDLEPLSRGLITKDVLARVGAELATVECAAIPGDVEEFRSDFRTAFGITSSGASLVRPDGYIAWRSRESTSDPTAALIEALTVAACAKRSWGHHSGG